MQKVKRIYVFDRFIKSTAIGRSIISHKCFRNSPNTSRAIGVKRWKQIFKIPSKALILSHGKFVNASFYNINNVPVSKEEFAKNIAELRHRKYKKQVKYTCL